MLLWPKELGTFLLKTFLCGFESCQEYKIRFLREQMLINNYMKQKIVKKWINVFYCHFLFVYLQYKNKGNRESRSKSNYQVTYS